MAVTDDNEAHYAESLKDGNSRVYGSRYAQAGRGLKGIFSYFGHVDMYFLRCDRTHGDGLQEI